MYLFVYGQESFVWDDLHGDRIHVLSSEGDTVDLGGVLGEDFQSQSLAVGELRCGV